MIHKGTHLQLIIYNHTLIVFLLSSTHSLLRVSLLYLPLFWGTFRLTHQLSRYAHEEKYFFLETERRKEVRQRKEGGTTWFGVCLRRGGCLRGDSVTRSLGADEATLSLLCFAAHGLSACHYVWFSQLARTRNSELEREKLTASENGRRAERWKGENRNISFLSHSMWWLLIIPGSRRRVAENSLIS